MRAGGALTFIRRVHDADTLSRGPRPQAAPRRRRSSRRAPSQSAGARAPWPAPALGGGRRGCRA
eukprot:6218118-Prymnesium_polylepis.1